MFLPKGIFRQGRRETGQPGSTDDRVDPKPVSTVPPTGIKHLLKLLVHVHSVATILPRRGSQLWGCPECLSLRRG